MKIAILAGSPTDESYIVPAYEYFDYFEITYETKFLSAHRNPTEVSEFAKSARQNGYSLLIGSAGMAAHLAGSLAAYSDLPILGVPMPGGLSDGVDALFSTVQMPKGVPVATFAVGKAGMINAAIFAAQMLSLLSKNIREKLVEFKANACNIPNHE